MPSIAMFITNAFLLIHSNSSTRGSVLVRVLLAFAGVETLLTRTNRQTNLTHILGDKVVRVFWRGPSNKVKRLPVK